MHYLVIETATAPRPKLRPFPFPPGIESVGTWLSTSPPGRIHLIRTHDQKLLDSWLSKQAVGVKYEVVRIVNVEQVRKTIERLQNPNNKAMPRQDRETGKAD